MRSEDVDAFWGSGAFLGIPGALILAAGAALLVISILKRPATARVSPPQGDPRFPGESQGLGNPTVPMPSVTTNESMEEELELPAGAEEDGRPARRLTCPRCHHAFVGQWGVPPVCPACRYSSPRR